MYPDHPKERLEFQFLIEEEQEYEDKVKLSRQQWQRHKHGGAEGAHDVGLIFFRVLPADRTVRTYFPLHSHRQTVQGHSVQGHCRRTTLV